MSDPFGKTLSGSRSLYVDDLTIGTVSITQSYSTVPYSITLPPIQGLVDMILVNNGFGNLTWRLPSVTRVTGILPVLNGGTGVTQSTGTEKVVLYRSPTFADDITVPTIKGGGIDGSLDITSGLNTSAILSIQSANIIGLTAPAIYIGPTRYPSTTGTVGQYLRTGAPASGFATSAWATIPLSETTGSLPTSRGGTGLTSIGSNGQYLVSNGSSLYWETPEQIGVMRYKQTYYPYVYLIPPSGMQIWQSAPPFGQAFIDFRTLYPVAGAQLGLALAYENFGRFANNYDFKLIVKIQYCAGRIQPLIPRIDDTPYDAVIGVVTSFLNGGSLFFIEKNNNGDKLAESLAPSGSIVSGSCTMILEPGDFFQLRGATNSGIQGLLNVESELFIDLQSYGATTVSAPSAPGSGTVTSVNITSADSFFAVGGGPITTSGTLSVGLSGSALPTASGGTGLSTVGTSGQVLTSNGTTLSYTTPTAGTITSVSASAPLASSGGATPTISFTGTLAVANGGTGVTTSTGSGSNVLSTAPTFTGATINSGLTLGTALTSSNGGTGLTTVGAIGTVLTSNGSSLSWQTPAAPGSGTVTSISTSTASAPFLSVSGGPITSTGTLSFGLSGSALPTSSGGTGSTAASTGTGGVVLRTSPTFTTSLITPQVTGTSNLSLIASNSLFLNSTGYMSIVSPSYLDIRGGFGSTNDVFIGSTRDISITATRDILLTSPTTKVSASLQTPAIVGSGVSGNLTITSTGIISSLSDSYQFFGSKSYLDIRGGFTGTNDIFMSATRTVFISGTTSVLIGSNSYPQSVGTNGQVLTTNGAGTITWQTPPGAGGGGGVSSVGLVSAAPFITVTGATIVTTGVFTLSIGTLGTANGGTGLTTVGTSGQVLTSNGTTLSWTNPGTGTVTNVGFSSSNSFITALGGGITGTGTLSVGINGALPTTNGGTGLSTIGTSGQVLTSNGSTLAWQTPAAPGTGTVTNVGFSSSNSFITASGGGITGTGTLSVGINGALPTSNGGTGSTSASTGTGGVVLRDSPTFTTKITTPEVAGSGESNDLAITSGRNITLTGGTGNAIFLNTALYARNKIIGDTGGDLIIENPSSFIFLNPGYSVRTGGMAFHAESANNQTFTGTVIGDQTIRSDSNLWIGPGGFSKLQLVGPNGCYANGARIDRKEGMGLCTISTTNLMNNSAGSLNLAQNTTSGSSLTLTSGGALLQNNLDCHVMVTLYFSAKRDSNGFGVDQFWVETSASGARYLFQETGALVRQSGTVVVPLYSGDYASVKWYQNSGSTLTCSTGSSDIVHYTLEQFF